MADKRMFSKQIIDSDAFLDMPQTSQLLYFHLSMRADDDGFINNPKSIMRNAKCGDDDLKILSAKKFIIPFETGIVVIKHWKIHNYIAKDRYKETKYKQEKSTLALDENNSYTLNENISYTDCIQNDNKMDTQVRLDKIRLEENSIDKSNIDKPKKEKVIYLDLTFIDDVIEKVKITQEQYNKLLAKYNQSLLHSQIIALDNYIVNGKGNKYKDHYRALNTWCKDKGGNNNSGQFNKNPKPTIPKTITGEGEELAKRAQEIYGDKLQDFECEF